MKEQRCPLCNEKSKLFFSDLKDYISHIKYRGILYTCTNPLCNHLFVFPVPDKKTINTFYTSYYTHEELDNTDCKFPYFFTFFLKVFEKINRSIGVHKERSALEHMFLPSPAQNKNKLLEIGCGSGSKLVTMRALGWNVIGQEIDKGSKKIHEKNLLNVYYNELQDIGFESDSFDAIGINHVIEHIPFPQEIMRECFRILKPEGKFIIITPNNSAIGGKLFKKYWHGYDFPRHLNIFSKESLISCALNEGFSLVESKTSACNAEVTASLSIESFFYKSHNTQLNKFYLVTFLSKIIQTLYFIYHKLFQKSGEELIVILTKKDT